MQEPLFWPQSAEFAIAPDISAARFALRFMTEPAVVSTLTGAWWRSDLLKRVYGLLNTEELYFGTVSNGAIIAAAIILGHRVVPLRDSRDAYIYPALGV